MLKSLDSRLRGNDKKGRKRLFTRPSILIKIIIQDISKIEKNYFCETPIPKAQ
jgi:hypothetical protein